MAGPQCCTPGPAAQHCCVGKEDTFGPFLSYVTSHTTPKAAVILISDIFGFEAPLFRKLADKIAGAGYYVVAPDYFNKDPFVPASGSDNPFEALPDWRKNHEALDCVDGTKEVISLLKEKGFSAIGAVGFCWGAKVVIEVAKGDYLNVAILAHPAWVTTDDIQDVKAPIAILAAEIDEVAPPALVKQYAEILESKKEVESFVHVYPGVHHGWTTRYNPEDEKEVANAEEVHNKMLELFGKFLQ